MLIFENSLCIGEIFGEAVPPAEVDGIHVKPRPEGMTEPIHLLTLVGETVVVDSVKVAEAEEAKAKEKDKADLLKDMPKLLLSFENRLRALEGLPAVTAEEFKNLRKGL